MTPAKGAGSHYRAITERLTDNALEEPRLAAREWNGHLGATICGRSMKLEELWVRHVPEPRDPICPACFPRGVRQRAS